MTKDDLKLYVVTDRRWLNGETLYEQVKKALKGGAAMVQFREKQLCGVPLEQEARKLSALCQSFHVPFLINDNVLLAKKINADGVHLGQTDMDIKEAKKLLGSGKIIGVTAKTVEQAKRAERNGADYIGSGAVFGSNTKTDAKPMELSLLKKICESVSIPVAAIGGIDKENIEKLKGCKIAGVAVASGIFSSADIEKETRQLLEKVEEVICTQH